MRCKFFRSPEKSSLWIQNIIIFRKRIPTDTFLINFYTGFGTFLFEKVSSFFFWLMEINNYLSIQFLSALCKRKNENLF
jgi:hypothetical protein